MSELMDEAVIRAPFDMAMESELSRKQFYDRANALLSELTELRAKLAELESQEPAIRVSGGRVVDFSPNYDGYVNEGDFYAKPVPADKPAVTVPEGWNVVTNENWNIPKLGQRVILFSNGVVQNESYTLDQADGEPGCGYYFWNRDDLDECPEVKAGDMWMLWPSSAAPSHSQQSADAVKAFCKYIGLYDPEYDDQGYIEVSRYKLKEHVESLYDRCPSHDSEQGG